ncbi:MAG: hypothetical protein AAF587_39585 [Bacteroidota bacterium]
MSRSCLFLFLLIPLFGCETLHQFTQTIQNTTSETIVLSFANESLNYYPDSISIAPNSIETIYSFEKFGAQAEGLGCGIIGNDVRVRIESGKTLNKDINQLENWNQELSGRRTVVENCSFSIEAADIQ